MGLIIFILALLGSLIWLWVGGISYMQQNHPGYKGEDLFNEEDKEAIS